MILVSCREIEKKNEEVKIEPQTEIVNKQISSEIIKPGKSKNEKVDFSKTIEPFIEKVLKENQRRHNFPIDNSEIQHLEIFEKNGLQEILAFSDKRYPKRIEPNYYEHFILFVLKYDNHLSAKNSYEKIKEIFQFESGDYKKLSKEKKKRIRRIEVSTKPGGMICYKANHVFSLVKTCRETPIGGKWEGYENLFLSFITEPEEEILILNANCGQMEYKEERRKPAHNTF